MTDKYDAAWRPGDLSEAIFQIAPGYWGDEAAFWRSGQEDAELLTPYLPKEPGVVLDYGCGIGRVLRYVPARRRIGADASDRMLELARAGWDVREHGDVEFVRVTDGALPLEGRSVDFCFSMITLQHMDAPDVVTALEEIVRVLVPGGGVWLQFSHFGEPYAPDRTLAREDVHWAGSPQGARFAPHNAIDYAADDVEKLARDAGLVWRKVTALNAETDRPYWVLTGRKRK